MPNKSFSIYPLEDFAADTADRLVLEVAKTHIACMIRNKNRQISAFELFTFTDNEAADFRALFPLIIANSKLLHKSFSEAEVFINNEFSLLVPIFQFSREIAPDYLTIMFGEDAGSKIQFEHVPAEPGMINVYRIEEELMNVLADNLPNITYKHTWSNIIKNILSDTFSLPVHFIYIQFYNTFIIVTVIKNGKLQIIQSFIYESPEDVLYYLLNISERFELNNNQLTLQISGLIDLNFTMYRELITYFRHVEVSNTNQTKAVVDIKEFPLHYFTPFFNLAQ